MAALAVSLAGGARNPEALPRDLEIQLALSALPPHLRDNATVYVLNLANGFEVARQGTNGFYALVARTYAEAEKGGDVLTVNFPHVMNYAPDVSDADIGAGKIGGMYPFVIFHDRHGYMIQPLGQMETAAVTEDYKEMLARLCAINNVWCLPPSTNQ